MVTGASSGIGAAFADLLAARGHDLVLIARREAALEARAARLREDHGIEVEVITADLATREGMRIAEDRLATGDISMLINNAGIGDLRHFAEADRDSHERMIDLNVTALSRLTHAAVAAMLPRAEGTIVNVASGLSFNIVPGAAVYTGTKGFVSQFTQALAAELADSGLRFQLLVPGLTRTNLGGAEGNGLFDQFPEEMVQSPEAVAQASLAGLALGELVCLPRLEDYSRWESARDATRAIGVDPPHNRTASRYA